MVVGAFIPYPAIERHGLVGDRRTAALISSDGTLDWLCLPDYDGHVIFGALLDANRGGFWRIGPAVLWAGSQHYDGAAPVLRTSWSTPDYDLDLVDAMVWPDDAADDRPAGGAIVRRLTCTRGSVDCLSVYAPAVDFEPVDVPKLTSGETYRQWSSDPSMCGCSGRVNLHEGDIVWFVMSTRSHPEWTSERAEHALADAVRFWTRAVDTLEGTRVDSRLVRSAVTIRLLEYAPAGSMVAAPTTSVPERIGGGWNADYRLTWVRDASLSIASLAKLGDLASARRYFDWLNGRRSTTESPLQVLYDVRGGLEPRQRERRDLHGYRGSGPVRFGNDAYRQHQHDKSGYLADCVLIYLDRGGRWDPSWWPLLEQIGDFTCDHWSEPGNSIWELPKVEHHVSSQVMAWVTLDRLLRIGARVGNQPRRAQAWEHAKAAIRHSVETDGWSDSLGAFRQSMESDALDASALLIPIFGFLPPTDRRVVCTVDRISERLTIDGCVYRFDPDADPKLGPWPMGEYEGAFLPCTFWLATACVMLGRRRDADDLLRAIEKVAGEVGLFAEAIDPRNACFLGNTPLLFSHVEYVRAVLAQHGRF